MVVLEIRKYFIKRASPRISLEAFDPELELSDTDLEKLDPLL